MAKDPVNPAASPAWSTRRWLWTIGALFALQVLSAWYWLDHRPLVSRHAPVLPSFNLASPQNVDPLWQTYLQLADPSLLARASQQGFSGAAWLQPSSLAPSRWTWADTNQGLGLNAFKLPDPKTYWIPPQPIWSFVAEKPAPFHTEFAVPAEIVETNSYARVLGDLQNRPLVATDRLPLWAHPELLKDTILHLLVSAPGHTLSARLDASSGLEAADQCALRWAKNARFQPLPQALPGTFPVLTPITAGQVVFRWGATNLPATNLPPGKS